MSLCWCLWVCIALEMSARVGHPIETLTTTTNKAVHTSVK